MKKILLIGDSIRIGYQSAVKEKLHGIAEVAWPEENCKFALNTLFYVDKWANEAGIGPQDTVHWNNGIWDTYHHAGGYEIFVPLEEYVSATRRILERLRKTTGGASIVWATTTAVKPNYYHNKNEEIDVYNDAVVKMMNAEGIAVNDLNQLIKKNTDLYIAEDFVHLTQKGEEACAEAVAKAVAPFLIR